MTFALIRGESYKQDRTYESLLNSMYFRGILFCFASALSFKQHENEDCEAKLFHFWILPGNLLSAVYSEKYLFQFFFKIENVCVQSSILTLIRWNYNLKKNPKICKIISYFANILNDDPPLLGVEPRIFNGCRICQDIIFIHQDITNARDSSALNVWFMLRWRKCI